MPKLLLPSAAMLMLLAGPALPDGAAAAPGGVVEIQQSQHIVIHVPNVTLTRTTIVTRSSRAPAPMAPPAPMKFKEKKADDCLQMQRITGFAVSRPDSVDLMLNDGSRRRAMLSKNCPALDFYRGFYVRPNPDGKMCANRDSIRSRAGRSCAIAGFRSLVPTK